MKTNSESNLVTALRLGDHDAFKQAYLRYKRDVLTLVASMLGRPDEAPDFLHDIFVSLARQAPDLAPDCNLKAYLLTSAANRVRDHLRKRRPRLAGEETMANVADSTANDPVRITMQRSEANELWKTLSTLPEEQRIVIAMRIYGGLTLKEIADREGISENTVQARYRYGLQKLRKKHTGAKP